MSKALKTSHKILIRKEIFYVILGLIIALQLVQLINTLIYAFDINRFNLYLKNNPLLKSEQAELIYRQILIFRMIINSVFYIGFAIYLYFAYKNVPIGFVFTLFWSFVVVGTIVSNWLLAHSSDLWSQVMVTIICVGLLVNLFYIFVLLKQNKFYENNLKRWV